jgi:hypothetical protein
MNEGTLKTISEIEELCEKFAIHLFPYDDLIPVFDNFATIDYGNTFQAPSSDVLQ